MGKKIIARELPPERCDFSVYFDDDGLKSAGGENCAIYIMDGRHGKCLFNSDEYKEICQRASGLLDDIGYVGSIFKSYEECVEEYMKGFGIEVTDEKRDALIAWARGRYAEAPFGIAEFLTIITGKEYECRHAHGYTQGDYCDMVYCKERYSDEYIEEIGSMWNGCGTEFEIDGCCGYFVKDTVRWNEGEELVNYLADCYGCKPDELGVELYVGEHRVYDYKTLVLDKAKGS